METRRRPSLLSTLFSLVVLASLCVGVYFGVTTLLRELVQVNSDVAKAIVTGSATVFAAVMSLVIGKAWEQRVRLREDLRQRKVPVYERQIELLFSVLSTKRTASTSVEDHNGEVQQVFRTFTEKLIIWGGPHVIAKWTAFRLFDWQAGEPRDGFLAFEAFVKAIRKELGNSNDGLSDGALLKLFINDFDKVSDPRRGVPPNGPAEIEAPRPLQESATATKTPEASSAN